MTADHGPTEFLEESRKARAAQAAWGALPVGRRLRPVAAFRRALARDGAALARTAQDELGRPAGQVTASDLLPTADACSFLMKSARKALKPRKVGVGQRPYWMIQQADTVHRRPRGVVAVIGTWNYPIFLSGVQILHAAVAGNAVLFKPSEVAPRTSELLHRRLIEAGFPAELIVRLPPDREAGPKVAEADIDHVVFTGSAGVGRRLAARLGERLISSTLELSGCDAMFVLADADLDLAARAAWFGATINNGQTCLAVRRVLVHRSRYEEFLARLRAAAVKKADAVTLATGPQADHARRLVADAVGKGARPLFGAAETAGRRFAPVALRDATPEMAVCREASFAPLLAVMPFANLADAVAIDRQCDYALGASVFTSGKSQWQSLLRGLDAGTVSVNDVVVPTAHPATPFGGRRASGWGVTQGPEGLLEMTVPQVVSERADDFRPHYDSAGPANPEMDRMIGGLMALSHAGGLRRRAAGLWGVIKSGLKLRPGRDGQDGQ